MAGRSKHIRQRKSDRVSRSAQWLICCEGETEVVYLRALIKGFAEKSGKRDHGIHIGLKDKQCAKQGLIGACVQQHIALFNEAQSCGSSSPFEKIWIVFDLDADGRPNEKMLYHNFAQTIKRAENNIEVAWSIPSFEYWMILHKKNLTATTQKTITDDISKIMREAHESGLPCRRDLAVAITDQCKKDKTTLCKECLDKPYCNSLVCLGGLAGVNEACKNSQRCYDENKDKIDKRQFKQISCCSSMHIMVAALMEYFEIETLDD